MQDGSRPGLSGALTRTLAARMQHDGLLWRRVMSMHAGAAYSGAHEPQELGLQGAPIPGVLSP